MQTGYQRPLETNDIWLVNPERGVDALEAKFEGHFQTKIAEGSQKPLLAGLYATFRREFLIGALCQLSSTCCQTASPYVLKYLIAFADDAYQAQHSGGKAPALGYGIGLVLAITALQLVMTFSINHFLYMGQTVGGEVRAVLMSRIFGKALCLSGRARAGGTMSSSSPPPGIPPGSDEEKKWYQKMLSKKRPKDDDNDDGWSNGRIVNLMSTDTHRIDQASSFFHMVWASPLSIVITMALLLANLGYSALPGLGLLFLSTPALTTAMRGLFQRRFAISRITDQRVSLTSEILQSIRFVKFFGWESSFLQRVDAIRNKEVRAVAWLLAIRDGIQAVSMGIPVFAAMLSFITYALSNHTLDPAPIFSSLALFNGLRMPLNMLPMIMGQVIDAYASTKRIQTFLLAEEAAEDAERDDDAKAAIVVQDASFTWERTQRPSSRPGSSGSPDTVTLADPFQMAGLSLTVGRSELVGVIGSVGSGKSSLLSALAGDMRKTAGRVTFGAQRAFCPQYAWVQNATVRDNILFGRDMDRDWYHRVTGACALHPDFAMLPDGDQTEIGERGITVSGGQKQRINIARAIYCNADIVLLDDPLSAVDAHVGRHIMDEAICGLLTNKCRILATHQLHVLNRCDRIVWLDGGELKAQGSYAELLQQNQEFAKLMALTSSDEEEKEKKTPAESIETVTEHEKLVQVATATSQRKALMQEEERATKAVSWSVYGAYLGAGGSLWIVPLVLCLLVLSQGANIMTSLWLSWWTAGQFPLRTGEWIGLYAGLGGGQAMFQFLFAVALSVFGTRASNVLFNRAMARVLRAPMRFFDTTPLGRITNRFSKDIDILDNSLTDAIRMYLMTIGQIMATFCLILAYYYYFAAALGPLVVIYGMAAYYYRASARELKRHEALQRSHVFAKFSEAVYGVSTIRAYGLQQHFIRTVRTSVDEFDGAYFLTFANQRWLSLRLDGIGLLMIFILSMLVVTSRFTVNPSTGGVVLSYMLSIMGSFQFAVRQMAEVENNMNSAERVHYYGTQLEEEAPEHVGDVPPAWPHRGEIVFENVQLRYRAGLPLVLQDVSMHVQGGERVGVVGRTGAGKSSIMQALFRLVELSGGHISIDGVDISKIGLHALRSRLSIIPQDPALFKGTIRTNLDPFQEHSEAALWAALQQADLGGVSLDTAVEEEGLNFSLGQRQLVALARALVRGSKVIVCDEATSSVDFATDQKVQRTLESLTGRTLLCIAHRLKTIIGYDRICVMDQGTVVEWDTPLALFDQGGIFRSMCEKGGIRRGDILDKM